MKMKYFFLAGILIIACHTEKQHHQIIQQKTSGQLSLRKDSLSKQQFNKRLQLELNEQQAWIEIIPKGNFTYQPIVGYRGEAERIHIYRIGTKQSLQQDTNSLLTQAIGIGLQRDSSQTHTSSDSQTKQANWPYLKYGLIVGLFLLVGVI